MKLRIALTLAALTLLGVACTAPEPDTLGVKSFEGATTDDTTPVAATPTTEAPAASTCDVAREALLTGTQADKDAAMAALVADTTADATARESAQKYLTEDNEYGLKDAYASSVQTWCRI